jgi:hypothetical protein
VAPPGGAAYPPPWDLIIVRGSALGIVVWLAAIGCTAAETPGAASIPPAGALVLAAEQPFVRVTAGPVSGLVPETWTAVTLAADGAGEGFLASPHPGRWEAVGGATPGVSAAWVDATEVGLASDMYYLAATGPLLSHLVSGPGCRATSEDVVVDHAPALMDGAPDSPGDFVARAEGVCRGKGQRPTRWAYFIAAPGFGPAMKVGIPGSGLYVVVAVTRDGPNAHEHLSTMLSEVRFGEASVSNFVRVYRTTLP